MSFILLQLKFKRDFYQILEILFQYHNKMMKIPLFSVRSEM